MVWLGSARLGTARLGAVWQGKETQYKATSNEVAFSLSQETSSWQD